jgi:NAD(P)-dependent dehydrogenase (short-subunit alcohol dehydrogenase family)
MATAKTTIALVTGANQGIGRAVAIQLARDHGYTVIIASRQLAAGEAVASELRSQGHQATSVQLDLTSDESIDNAVKTIDQKYGRLDVLVNNAGLILDAWTDDVPKLHPRELYDRTLATNFTGTACLTEALFPLLRKAQGGPNIVFVSTSMGSLTHATNPEIPWYNLEATAYDCSKAAVNMLGLNYARRLKDVNARVNMVSPGLVTTNLTRFNPAATTPEVGAEHVVKLATAGEGGPNMTFSAKEGPIPW